MYVNVLHSKEFMYTEQDKTERFLIYKEIQKGAVAKSKTNGLLIYD